MQTALPPSTETGKLGIMHLKRFWYKTKNGTHGVEIPSIEVQLDKTVLFAVGVGLQQGIKATFQTNSFEDFEDWITTVAGTPIAETTQRFNNEITGNTTNTTAIHKIFTDEEMDGFNRDGYIILRNAISADECNSIIDALCNFAAIDKDDPQTWYDVQNSQAIMIQLFQHPALQKTRDNLRIRRAFEQLWNRTDIWPSLDRVGFNPPATVTHPYKGDGLHWDVSLQQPIPFALQGLIYLTDTEAHQGAFTLVPGFQHKIGDWLQSLPAGSNPRSQNLNGLGSQPIAANAGDLIIWQQALPHGASPNRSDRPRFVQYLSYNPAILQHQQVWI
ncbi:phytanoyl-CoA dioxygenase [Mucilaginibacter conchicola]|uniref:Phytanoyl-CoA dioxygenase n=1 Tax=Mucilaginibacter conchicola TaxID=2303333 RepID=A0A372NXD9_9SPHI|nr:phytanoyl-CoA dioxygenase family protein [Mucilaginibacter conchicola]RFZ94778.1 phytanoyl-CoA dioxygenase [Mucilaginibacter conchicola]